MKNFSSLQKTHAAGFVFTCLAGTLLHFAYDLSGQNRIVAAFAATNESTWEHLKLLWVPMAVFGIFSYFLYGKNRKNFLSVTYLSAAVGMAFITVFFYTYSGVLGKSIDIVNIALYFIAAAISWYFSYKYMQTDRFSSPFVVPVCRVLAALTAVCFVVWSYNPPSLGIFISPV